MSPTSLSIWSVLETLAGVLSATARVLSGDSRFKADFS